MFSLSVTSLRNKFSSFIFSFFFSFLTKFKWFLHRFLSFLHPIVWSLFILLFYFFFSSSFFFFFFVPLFNLYSFFSFITMSSLHSFLCPIVCSPFFSFCLQRSGLYSFPVIQSLLPDREIRSYVQSRIGIVMNVLFQCFTSD